MPAGHLISRVTILGTGLIGGSFALALRKYATDMCITGWDRAEVAREAHTCGALDEAFSGDLAPALQNAGLIQSQTFNAVLMGTSLAAGIRPSKIDRILGVKSVKLVMNGSGAREQSFVLEAALKKKADVVIWEIDHWIFRNDLTDLDSQSFFPANLYRKNVKGAIEYLLNIDTAQESLGLLISEVTTFRAVYSRLVNWGYLRFVFDDVDSINVPSREFDHSAMLGIKAYRRLSNPNINYGSANGYVYQSLLGNFDNIST